MWHHYRVTSYDVEWYNHTKQKLSAIGDGTSIGAIQKVVGEKLVDWYIGIQNAVALQDQRHEGDGMAVVHVQSHPFRSCCFNKQGRYTHLYDDDGRKITHLYNRAPLKPSNHQNEKNDCAPNGKRGKVVHTTKPVQSACEPLCLSNQIISALPQLEKPPKDEIKEDNHHPHHENDAIYVDENDTCDDDKNCHFPQHHTYVSRSIVEKKKPKKKKKRQ